MDKFVVKSKRDLTVDNSHAHCDDTFTSSDYSRDAVLAVTGEFNVPVERLSRDDYIRRGPIRPALASYLRLFSVDDGDIFKETGLNLVRGWSTIKIAMLHTVFSADYLGIRITEMLHSRFMYLAIGLWR